MQDKGVVRVLLKSSVKSIGETDVVLSCEGEKEQRMRNDAVIVCAGGELPFDLLKKVGVSFETHRGAAKVQ